MDGSMRASYEPLRASARRLESPFSWGFLRILLLTLELLLPICSDACGDPPRYQSMKTKGDPKPPYNAGFKVDYECRLGYRLIVPLVLPTSAVCQADGTWAPPLQEACTVKSCPQPEEPQNGKIVYISGSSILGSQAQYVCNKGYYLVGKKILKCELTGNDVAWNGDPPACEKVLCKPPQQIPNGEFTNSHKDTFEYNEVVTYRCKPLNGTDKYSLVGESRLVCSGPNQWSSEPPECKVVRCEYPVLENGRLVSGFGKTFLFKAKVTFKCLNGFYLEGNSTIVCGADSTWSPKIPKCIKGGSTPSSTPSSKPPNSADDLDGGLIAVIILTVLVGAAVVGTCV